ncbi:Hypothetical_protein [Hexamita inflata]|uniref:Hypothetical_protein n=1 Tax=Hexamita inflata TaxID=28002 RepID=A0AA86QQV8_9EUKA|nr:Hypothetical protein HINF_LOCUS46477 [Hexamita inflata]
MQTIQTIININIQFHFRILKNEILRGLIERILIIKDEVGLAQDVRVPGAYGALKLAHEHPEVLDQRRRDPVPGGARLRDREAVLLRGENQANRVCILVVEQICYFLNKTQILILLQKFYLFGNVLVQLHLAVSIQQIARAINFLRVLALGHRRVFTLEQLLNESLRWRGRVAVDHEPVEAARVQKRGLRVGPCALALPRRLQNGNRSLRRQPEDLLCGGRVALDQESVHRVEGGVGLKQYIWIYVGPGSRMDQKRSWSEK